MPNDAKLGLFLGICLVVVIGLVFFRAGPAAHDGHVSPVTSVNSSPESPHHDHARRQAKTSDEAE